MWTKSGLSPFQSGSSLFSRGRVRYRRELVQPSAGDPWSPRYIHTQMRPFPNSLPERKTVSWREQNVPFVVHYPSQTESMLFGDALTGKYYSEPFSTMDRDGSLVISPSLHPLSQQSSLYKHAFDSDDVTCGLILHRSTDGELVVHGVEGKLRAYIWKPGDIDSFFPDVDKTIQVCIKSVENVLSVATPYRTVILTEGNTLKAPKNHVVGLEDIDDIPDTYASFNHKI